jgi:hypothetical protein
VGIAEAIVATAAALAPARVASADDMDTKASVRFSVLHYFYIYKGHRMQYVHQYTYGPREQRLARASFWSRDARLTVDISGPCGCRLGLAVAKEG